MYTYYTISGRMEIKFVITLYVYITCYYIQLPRPKVHDFCSALRGVSSVVISLFFSLTVRRIQLFWLFSSTKLKLHFPSQTYPLIAYM